MKIPCCLAGRNVFIKTEIVEADFPLLLGNSLLKRAGAVLCLGKETAIIMGTEVRMRETSSGHFCLDIQVPKQDQPYTKSEGSELLTSSCKLLESNSEPVNELCLVGELTLKDVEKLHHQFGHSKKVVDLIKNANKLTEEVEGYLDHVEENCESCKVNRKRKPKPAVGLPRASKFNQVVTMDLKQYQYKNYQYILYLVDIFSRFMVALFLTKKEPSVVGAAILEKWIAVFGRMETIHSDRGGEFCATELTDIAEYLGVLSTFTAAYSPNQNGLNERNHALCDRMMDKMRTEDPGLRAELALTWSVVAKNSLQNVSGFSPYQIVFGQQPSLPSVYSAGPPGMEEVVMTKAVADNINAMHLARQAYIECESDRVLKAALKQRIYKRGDDIKINDWIYYNNPKPYTKSKWEGPVKVVGKDKKTLYAVRGGKLLSINSDHAQLSGFEGIMKEKTSTEDENIRTAQDDVILDSNKATQPEKQVEEEAAATSPIARDELLSTLRKNDVVRYKKEEDEGWIERKLVSRGGKVGGVNEKWWNVENVESGHIQGENLGDVKQLEKVTPNADVNDDVYVVQIPRYRHHENCCKTAKEKELNSWDDYMVYEEVVDKGQERLGTNWVLTEKLVKGVRTVKARLTVRGDQEETEDVRKDSPTVRKGNIKIFSCIAAKEGWDICASDVTCAFLQGAELTRDVFVLPPRERRVPGTLWKLLKPVYGLVDAPRGWYLALDERLRNVGFTKSDLDEAMYLHFSKKDDIQSIAGIALTHVDDILHGGNETFKHVMLEVKQAFNFGTDENDEFRYVGMHMKRMSDGILVDQDHYVKAIELPSMEIAEGLEMNDTLSKEGQTLFRGHVAKLLHVGYQSRPDSCFEAKCLSTKFGKATKSDLKTVLKKIQKLQGLPTVMYFPDLGPVDEWIFVGYGDAGIKSMPDKISSVGGQVILLANTYKNRACVLNWRSKKLVRKVVSSLAGEALAVVATIGEIVYTRAIMKQIYGDVIDSVPVVMFTDSKNLYEAVHSSSLVDDSWLIIDVAIIKDALKDNTITCLKRVASGDMLANCLTKAGASSEQLLRVLQTGNYVLPPGLA